MNATHSRRHRSNWKISALARAGCLAALMVCCSSSAWAADSDNFNDGEDSGWLHYQPLGSVGAGATYSFPSGGYRILASNSPDPGQLGPSRAGSLRTGQTYTDLTASVDLIDWDNTHDQAIGLLFRLTDIGSGSEFGTLDGYAVTYAVGSHNITITRSDNEVPDNLVETPITLDPAAGDYRLVVSATGPTITASVYNVNDLSTPLATVTTNDATYPSGVNGLVVFDNTNRNTADATFDNYSVPAVVPEPAAAGLVLLAGLALRRRR